MVLGGFGLGVVRGGLGLRVVLRGLGLGVVRGGLGLRVVLGFCFELIMYKNLHLIQELKLSIHQIVFSNSSLTNLFTNLCNNANYECVAH